MAVPDADLRERIARICGATPVAWVRRTGGYTPAERWVATLPDGSSVFVKMATTPLIARWLRNEARIYANVHADAMPAIAAFEDDPERPLLVMEDLTYAHWPPPWSHANVEALREAILAIGELPAPDFLPRATDHVFPPGRNWDSVAKDPAAFLSLGLADAGWLERALPALLAAEHAAVVEGDAVLHMDVRSDNTCFTDESEAVLVDWNHSAKGPVKLQFALWAPSLHYEGGPAPETLLPHEPGYAALISGYFAARAGLALIPDAPHVRRVQREQLTTALPWAIRALDLPPLPQLAGG